MLQSPSVEQRKFTNGSADPKGEFSQWLLAQIQDENAQPVVLTITPDMAKVMLRWNNRNRPLTKSKVKVYSDLMEMGRWMYNGVPIIFSNERLIDGQHRLRACVETRQPFDALLVFNAPDDAFYTIDVGKARSAGDIFAINGVSNWALIAAAVKWVYGYESDRMGTTAKSSLVVDHAALYEFYLKNRNIDESAWVGHLFAQSRLTMPSLMVGLHYLCAKRARKEADSFFRAVAEGIGFSGKKDPAFRLHKRLLDNIINQEKLGRKQVAALTIKAWNAHRLGREIGTLKFTADEKFPKVI